MIRESKYIIRRVIVGVLIALVLSFINSCEVHAEVRNVFDYNTKIRYYPNNTLDRIYLNNTYTLPSGQGLYGIEFDLETNGQDHFEAGQYLFDFIVVSNQLQSNLTGCSGIVSDFKLYDLTSSKWISSASQSKSQCIGSYYSNTNGIKSIHYLFSWTTNNTSALDILWTRSQLFVYNTNLFVTTGGNYSVVLGNLQDYDSNIVSDFNNISISQQNSQDIINNQNQNTQNIINNQNQNQAQNHQDSINEQNAINNNTQAQNETNDILEDSSIPSDSDSKINDIVTSTQTQNANISDLVNFIPNTLQVIINGFNNNCAGGYSLGSLYGTELVIPCINPVDYLGSFLWGVIDSILCLCYLIPLSKFLVNKYNDLTSLKNLRWQ